MFKSLIALPSLNDFETTPANGTETDKPLLAALDENENLLVPFDYSGEKQDTEAPIATLLSGFTEIDAEFPPQGVPLKLRERLGQGQNGDSLIRVFTLDGRPLPPLRKVTNDGTIFGLIDADSSVMRLECSAVHPPSLRKVCDLKGLAPYPGTPVVPRIAPRKESLLRFRCMAFVRRTTPSRTRATRRTRTRTSTAMGEKS